MNPDPYLEMQKAVDIVNNSPHPTNKIAATVFGVDSNEQPYSIACTNYWPLPIEKKLGTQNRIGNSSGTLHAETACILAAPRTEGASLCITDPFCPNCAKNIAEAGIKTIYLDHKGFDKDFAARRHHHFKAMSMQICEKAGISVYEIWRKDKKLVSILEHPADYRPDEKNPVIIAPCPADPGNDPALGTAFISRKVVEKCQKPEALFAAALAENEAGALYSLYATANPSVGYPADMDKKALEAPGEKYSFIVEPVNRLLMTAARRGMTLKPDSLYVSQVPTARALVNLVGAGLTHIAIADPDLARDKGALEALETLQNAGILIIHSF